MYTLDSEKRGGPCTTSVGRRLTLGGPNRGGGVLGGVDEVINVGSKTYPSDIM